MAATTEFSLSEPNLSVLPELVETQIQEQPEQQEQQELPDQQVQDPVVAVKDDVLAVKDMNVTIVQDVSGSMEDQRRSVVTGINEIVGELKSLYKEPCPHAATVRIIQFSSHTRISVGDAVPVHDVVKLNESDLVCDGMTALWDAAAIAINLMTEHGAGVPATTYIFSDGDNNDSKKHTQRIVNQMIAENKKQNPMHSVLFIGSDPSTKRNADGMGLDRVHSIQHDSDNTPVAYEVCRRALGRCVTGDTQSTEFNNDDIVMSETPSALRGSASPCGYASPCDYASPCTDSQTSDDFACDDNVPSRSWSSGR
jgi:hypothetical protein